MFNVLCFFYFYVLKCHSLQLNVEFFLHMLLNFEIIWTRIGINPSRPQPRPPPSNPLLQRGDKNRQKVLFRESDHTLPHPTLWFLFECQRQWRSTSEKKRVAVSQRLETGKVYGGKKNNTAFCRYHKKFYKFSSSTDDNNSAALRMV